MSAKRSKKIRKISKTRSWCSQWETDIFLTCKKQPLKINLERIQEKEESNFHIWHCVCGCFLEYSNFPSSSFLAQFFSIFYCCWFMYLCIWWKHLAVCIKLRTWINEFYFSQIVSSWQTAEVWMWTNRKKCRTMENFDGKSF